MVNLQMEGPFLKDARTLHWTFMDILMDVPSSCVGAVGNRNRTSSTPDGPETWMWNWMLV